MMELPHHNDLASPWVQRWSHLVASGGTVLDLACGHGRHVRWFSQRGHPVVAVDRAPEALDALADLVAGGRVRPVVADLENAPWPFMDGAGPQQFAAVVVTNYLWRPLLPIIVQSLAPGGVLLYETFAVGNASVGKPARSDFLLVPGELLRACSGLRVVAYEDGFCTDPDRFVQRIAAVRTSIGTPAGPTPGDANPVTPTRYLLG